MSLWPFHSADALSAATAVMSGPNLGAAEQHVSVKELEDTFASRLVSPGGNAAFFNSGTSALCAALFALDIAPGSEVIVPSSTFRSTVTPLFQFGLVPVLAPCDPDTMTIDPEGVQTLISPKTRAVIVNHQWGIPSDMARLARIAALRKLFLIEDASHAHSTAVHGQPVGTFGDLAVFSCGTTKLLSGGLGGLLYSRNKTLFDQATLFGLAKHRVLATAVSEVVRSNAQAGLGVNLRGHPVAAELALHHLRRLDEIVRIKNQNLETLIGLLQTAAPHLKPLDRPARWTGGTWYKLPCRAPDAVTASAFIKVGKSVGLRVEACHQNLNRQFETAFPDRKILAAKSIDYVDGGGPTFEDVVLFDTRDLYVTDVDFVSIGASLREAYSSVNP